MNDIEVLEKFANESVLYGGTVAMTLEKYKALQFATNNLLKERQSDKEKRKELEEETDLLIGQNEWYKDYYDCESIPKSLIKEKIEEYKKLLKSCNKFSDVDRIKAINERILALEELLNTRI